MATHSSILAWKITWTEEPGGLQSVESQRAGHDWLTSFFFSFHVSNIKNAKGNGEKLGGSEKRKKCNIFLSTYYILRNSVVGFLLTLSQLILTKLLQGKR